jgi:hypothetical protein
MTVARTTLLDLPIITTGTESGLWGDYTNNGLTQYLDISIAGMSNLTSANFTAGALTIETTEGTNSATNIVATSAQYAGFRVSSLAVNSTITVGNTGTTLGRSYRLINADSTYTLTFKATGQTGVTLQPGQSATVAFNGTDYVFVGVVLGAAQTFTATQTVRAAPTQDGVALAGRAGGTSSYAATITPPTLAANITLTTPSQTATLGYINIPQSGSAKTTAYILATSDVGEFIEVGSGGSIEIPNSTFSAGDAVLVFNNTAAGITITCTITTAYIAGTDADKDTVTLATRGIASILFVSGTVCVISGNVS